MVFRYSNSIMYSFYILPRFHKVRPVPHELNGHELLLIRLPDHPIQGRVQSPRKNILQILCMGSPGPLRNSCVNRPRRIMRHLVPVHFRSGCLQCTCVVFRRTSESLIGGKSYQAIHLIGRGVVCNSPINVVLFNCGYLDGCFGTV